MHQQPSWPTCGPCSPVQPFLHRLFLLFFFPGSSSAFQKEAGCSPVCHCLRGNLFRSSERRVGGWTQSAGTETRERGVLDTSLSHHQALVLCRQRQHDRRSERDKVESSVPLQISGRDGRRFNSVNWCHQSWTGGQDPSKGVRVPYWMNSNKHLAHRHRDCRSLIGNFAVLTFYFLMRWFFMALDLPTSPIEHFCVCLKFICQ